MYHSGLTSYVTTNTLFQSMYNSKCIYSMEYSTTPSKPSDGVEKSDDLAQQIWNFRRENFKKVVKDYGATVIILHIGISLISLGACYTAVASGVDLKPVINYIYDAQSEKLEEIINQSSLFLIAYSVHKLMAPIRIGITLGVAPILVRYLRKIGLLKPPVKKISVSTKL